MESDSWKSRRMQLTDKRAELHLGKYKANKSCSADTHSSWNLPSGCLLSDMVSTRLPKSAWPDKLFRTKAKVTSNSHIEAPLMSLQQKSGLEIFMFSHLLLRLEIHLSLQLHYGIMEKMIICNWRRDRSFHNRRICHKYCFHDLKYGSVLHATFKLEVWSTA